MLGGHFATTAFQGIMNDEYSIDSIICGDGEVAIYELCQALLNEMDFNAVHGLVFRDPQSKEVKTNKQRELLTNLDVLPWPARDTLEEIKRLNHPWPTQIATSRGCYGNCSFCGICSFYGRNWRARSAKDVVDEIEYLHNNYGSTVFRLTDDEFIGLPPRGPSRALAIAQEIILRKLDIHLMISARAKAVNKDLFSALRKAGVDDCLIGVESSVDRILQCYHKGISTEDSNTALKILSSVNVRLNLAFIMFDPRMTLEDLKQNYYYLQRNKLLSVDVLKSRLWALHGSDTIKQLEDCGLLDDIGVCEVKYSYKDSRVYQVLKYVDKLAMISFEYEKTIYYLRKYHMNIDISRFNQRYLDLWCEEFESMLTDPSCYTSDAFGSKMSNLLTSLQLQLEQMI